VAGEAMRQASLAAGFQMYLLKPVRPDELIGTIARLLESRQRPSTLPS
jgi:CheY-like chemotaxis protein